MALRQRQAIRIFFVIATVAAALALVNHYSIVVMRVEGARFPRILDLIYTRLYNLYDYVNVAFNPPVWERKENLERETQKENLRTTALPVFDLFIAEDDIHQLNARIPRNPAFIRNSPIYYADFWVPGTMKHSGKEYAVEVKHRGTGWWHWAVPKKSLRVKIKKHKTVEGERQFNFVNPKSVVAFTQVIEYRLARYLGLLAPEAYMSHLRLNNAYYGIMFTFEQPDKFFLRRNERPQGDIYGEKTPVPQLFQDARYWEKFCAQDDERPDDFRNLEGFLKVINEKDRKKFAEDIGGVLDMDAFYRWYVHAVILASAHQNDHNIKLYFDPVKRKFEFFPWDVVTDDMVDFSIDTAFNRVTEKILAYPEFNFRKDRALWEAVKDDRLLAWLLSSINELDAQSRPDIFCDPNRDGLNFKGADYRDYQYRYPLSQYELQCGFLRKYFIDRIDFIRHELKKCAVRAYLVREGPEYFLHVVQCGKIAYKANAVSLSMADNTTVSIPVEKVFYPELYIRPAAASGTSQESIGFLPREYVHKVDIGKYSAAGAQPVVITGARLIGANAVTDEPLDYVVQVYENNKRSGQ
ncbi:MAG: CotH kinase family protein [Candidatus Omnitrophica bacterium]|nr:CotH kinase family protein [Candidatus Omnitrophota bacterium]